jgi:hypothetical protein
MKNLLSEHVAPYNKAIVPLVVAVVLGLLARVGVTNDMSISEALTLVVTSGLVYAVPNKTK